jgi:hypothetical protein
MRRIMSQVSHNFQLFNFSGTVAGSTSQSIGSSYPAGDTPATTSQLEEVLE